MFRDRLEAGLKLAKRLQKYANKEVIVLGLPRGGIVVGAELAKALKAPLDIVVPRKIGAPENPEYAIGAITETGKAIFNEIEQARVNPKWLKAEIEKEIQEALRRIKTYRGDRPPLDLTDKIVIMVDDGVATGLTMRAAIAEVRTQNPKKIIIAVPVSAKDSAMLIRREADDFVALEIPSFFGAVGAFYEKFPQITDQEVVDLLRGNSSS